MRIVAVGTGSLVPSLERGQSCLLVEEEGARAVCDLGVGSLTGLLKAGVAHREIDLLALTHFHPDHVAELGALLFAANYDPVPRTRPLTIVGGEGVEEHLGALGALHGRWVEARNYRLSVVTLAPGGELKSGPLTLRASRAAHTPSSLAYRVEGGGGSLAITGDTGPSSEIELLARGCDLLVAECSLSAGETRAGHLNALQAGEMAAHAGVSTLLLTHFYPGSEVADPVALASEAFGGRVLAARDGLELIL